MNHHAARSPLYVLLSGLLLTACGGVIHEPNVVGPLGVAESALSSGAASTQPDSAVCGDFECSPGEDEYNCPGDCCYARCNNGDCCSSTNHCSDGSYCMIVP